MPNDPQYTDPNPGISRSLILDTTLNDAASRNGINQIRGLDSKGSLGSGIPKHVTNVGASVAQAATGTTSTVRVTFHRDPSDKNYSAAGVWVKGYQGNNNPVQVAQSYESPATFVLNNTGEPVSVLVQSVGNGGQAPLSSAPTTGITLPKSTIAGYGTGTTVAYTPASPPPVTTPTVTRSFVWSFESFLLNGGSFNNGGNWGKDAVTNNALIAIFLELTSSITVSTISAKMGTLNGGTVCVAIYDSTGTTKLIDAGAGFSASSSGVQTITLGTAVTLSPGQYWVASGATTANNSSAWGWTQIDSGNEANLRTNRLVTCANAISAGAMPSSLGALTAAAARTNPLPGFFLCNA